MSDIENTKMNNDIGEFNMNPFIFLFINNFDHTHL